MSQIISRVFNLSDKDYNNLVKAFAYLSPYKLNFFGAMTLIIIGLCLGLLQPYFFGRLVDVIAENRFELMWKFVGFVFSLYLLSSFFNMLETFVTIKIGNSIILDVKADIYNQLMRLPLKAFDSMQVGEILNRIEGDASTLSSILVRQSLYILVDITRVIVIGMLMLKINIVLTLVLILSFPISLYIFRLFGRRQRKISQRIAKHRDGYFGLLGEIIAGIKEIKALGIDNKFKHRLKSQNTTIVLMGTKLTRLEATAAFSNSLIGGLGLFVALLLGTNFISQGYITLGSLVAFNSYTGQFYSAMRGGVMLYSTVQTSIVSINRLFDLLDNLAFPTTSSGTVILDDRIRNINFEDVTFSYDDKKNVLNSISVRFSAGRIIAVVGNNGAGKSTLFNLLLRFYDQQHGFIRCNGSDIREFSVDAWRSKIALLLQEPVIFNETITENLRYARPDANFDEIVEVCRRVHLHELFKKLPDGYDTILDSANFKLSAGQKQRLALARGILKRADIYLFDEPMTALDGEVEQHICDLIVELGKENLVVLIAHSLSTVKLADWVYVLDSGRVVEEGAPCDLQTSGVVYKRLFGEQFKVS